MEQKKTIQILDHSSNLYSDIEFNLLMFITQTISEVICLINAFTECISMHYVLKSANSLWSAK